MSEITGKLCLDLLEALLGRVNILLLALELRLHGRQLSGEVHSLGGQTVALDLLAVVGRSDPLTADNASTIRTIRAVDDTAQDISVLTMLDVLNDVVAGES
ncbi:hypothetical protein [Kitasatospora aureofaciens]|uniref:hypothetical protein n=1 Tax=Kitasatospora aureofaciens TaxID=1894 RepID=UPI003400AA40